MWSRVSSNSHTHIGSNGGRCPRLPSCSAPLPRRLQALLGPKGRLWLSGLQATGSVLRGTTDPQLCQSDSFSYDPADNHYQCVVMPTLILPVLNFKIKYTGRICFGVVFFSIQKPLCMLAMWNPDLFLVFTRKKQSQKNTYKKHHYWNNPLWIYII